MRAARSLQAAKAHAAYLIWTRTMALEPLPQGPFVFLMRSFIALLGVPTVAAEAAADGSVTFRGLSL
jgi:hypothetical protein